MKECPNCRKSISDHALFCEYCGSKVLPNLSCLNIECPSYGKTILPPNAVFCPDCGNRVSFDDYAVDLGLSVKWMKCNLGSSKPEELRLIHTISDDELVTEELGYGWRVPTVQEFIELFENCNVSLDVVNSIKGEKITGKNGNSIFFPTIYYEENEDRTKWVGIYGTKSSPDNDPDHIYCHFICPNAELIKDIEIIEKRGPIRMIRPVLDK